METRAPPRRRPNAARTTAASATVTARLVYLAVGLVVLLVVVRGVYASPACMAALHDELLPACHHDVCGETCCVALRFPDDCATATTHGDHNGGGGGWSVAFTRHVLETLERRRARGCTPCKTRLRLPCAFSTQDANSPCFASACDRFFEDGTLSSACEDVIRDHCVATTDSFGHTHTSAACLAFDRAKAANCSSSTSSSSSVPRRSFALCSVALHPDAGWPGTVLDAYAQTRLGRSVRINAVGGRWATTYGCSTMSRGRCPCVDRVLEGDGTTQRLMACAFSTPLPTCSPQVTMDLFIFAILAPILHIAANADEAILRRFSSSSSSSSSSGDEDKRE